MRTEKKNPEIQFYKYQGVGNDFVLLDMMKHPVKLTPSLIRKLCAHHVGVGSDGVLTVEKADKKKYPQAVYRMRMYNPDGTEDMCGNGLRCAIGYLYHAGYVKAAHFFIQAYSGLRETILTVGANKELKTVAANLGKPVFKAKSIPVAADLDQVLDYPLKVAGRTIKITALSTGTPHAVVFTSNPSDIESLGEPLSIHPFFPRQACISFVKVESRRRLIARIFESRGVGESGSCGTGAAAILTAATLKGFVNRAADIHFPGGILHVRWDKNDDLWLTGPVKRVFRGTIE